MNLQEFNKSLPKSWLDVKANSVTSNLYSVKDNADVPNPPVGYVSLYSEAGLVKSVDALGTESTFITTSQPQSYATQVQAVQLKDKASPLAPSGQRDLWQYGTSAAGSIMIYSSVFDKIWTFGSGLGTASYSTDGGVTFAACVFDVVSAGLLALCASPTKVIALSDDGKNAYTSVDGINFTSVAVPAYTYNGKNIWWSSLVNLFIAGFNIDATHTIMTSPDGITWTSRASTLTVTYIKSNSSIIVATCSTAPYLMYSADGITWTNSAISLGGNMRALAWSEEQQIWAAGRNGTAELFTSPDGITWTSKGNLLPAAGLPGDSLMWVASGIDRWYASLIDSAGNYSLVSSPDTSSVFVGGYLDGATTNTIPYSLQYDASRNRFYMGVNTSPFFAYSTPRLRDIKALSDNIRVRGSAVDASLFSSYSNVTVNNTLTETSLTSGLLIGSKVLQDPLTLGMVIDFRIYLASTSAAGDTLTIRIKSNATTLHTIAMTIPALAVGLVSELSGTMVVQAANIQINAKNSTSAVANVLSASNPAFNPNVTNTLDVTAQWGANVNQLTMTAMEFNMHFRNGA